MGLGGGSAHWNLAFKPYLPALVNFLPGPQWLLIFVALCFVLAILWWTPTGFMLGTRNMFAWSFDRLAPEKLTKVSDRFHTPVIATITVGCIVELLNYLNIYQGLGAYLLNVIAVMALAFIIVSLSAAATPWRRPQLHAQAPGWARAKLARRAGDHRGRGDLRHLLDLRDLRGVPHRVRRHAGLQAHGRGVHRPADRHHLLHRRPALPAQPGHAARPDIRGDPARMSDGGTGEPAMVAAGRAIVATAAARSIPVRLVGGVAIYLRGSPPARAALGRSYPDIDLVAHKKQSRALRACWRKPGSSRSGCSTPRTAPGGCSTTPRTAGRWTCSWTPSRCRTRWTWAARLEAEPETLAAAELLLTKLQIAEVNRKDLSDTAMLLWDHQPAGQDGPGLLNVTAVTGRCAADWGLHTTVTDNLAACAGLLGELVASPGDRDRIAARIGQLSQALDDAPKSMGWKARARVGRRMRWYELPEEVTR